jgi:hypothetical protein
VLFDFVGMIFNRLLYYPFEIAFFARKRGRRFPQHSPQRFDPPLIGTPKIGQPLIEIW